MSRIRTALVGTVAAGLMALTVSAGPALAEPSTTTKFVNTQIADGWWLESPTEITTDVSASTSVESDETFSSPSSQIRQPINPDGTSTWPAKRGVIPVQFNLTMSPTTETTTTTTTTTTVTRRPSFKSIGSDGSQDWYASDFNDASILTHRMPAGTKVADITSLVANYQWLNGGTNHGGSLRWVIQATGGDIWVQFGPSPNFVGNDPGSGVNMMSVGDNRYDLSRRGGSPYNTLASILGGPIANEAVQYISLTVDGGWGGNQEIDLQSVDVDTDFAANDHVDIQDSYTGGLEPADPWVAWSPGDPFVESDEDVESVVGAPVATNAIPAFIRVEKQPTDSTPLDVIEELSSAQGDSTGQFRQIDGKYMYNLKAETLGKGSFKVYMVIDGTKVENLPGVFELR